MGVFFFLFASGEELYHVQNTGKFCRFLSRGSLALVDKQIVQNRSFRGKGNTLEGITFFRRHSTGINGSI